MSERLRRRTLLGALVAGAGTALLRRHAEAQARALPLKGLTRRSLARLRQEHEDYDAAINAMIQTSCDALRIQRMKKKKLAVKDKMTQLEDQVIPDIIA